MFGLFRSRHRLPPLTGFHLNTYSQDFSLERLILGVDNIRYDVLLSPTVVKATTKILAHLVARHAGVEKRNKRGMILQPSAVIKTLMSRLPTLA